MNQAEMVTLIAQRCAVSQTFARGALDDLLHEIAARLGAGERVHLPGIGSLTARAVPPRKNGRNPRTGAPIDIPARRKIRFTTAAPMKARLAASPVAQAAE